jgi:hypothetical protein
VDVKRSERSEHYLFDVIRCDGGDEDYEVNAKPIEPHNDATQYNNVQYSTI